MPYLIFARKYRPQTFEEVVGQNSVVQTLQNAIKTGRVTQAYLFSGMRGTGKTTLARILAKALNCANGPTPNPCRIDPDKEKDTSCEFCRAIHTDKAIDVLEIDGASNRGIDEIRALREALKYKAIHSRYKVVIIDEVHQITKDGFNALLKTLEEPPPNTIFVFATTEFHKVPQTIVSRCQHFEFKKISRKDIINHLMEICKKEAITITPLGLTMIAEAADGSMRDAQSLLDQAVAFSGENIQDEDLKIILGTIGQDILFRFSTVILEERPEDVFPLVESVIASGHDLRFFYSKLVEHFRALLLVGSMGQPGDLLVATSEELEALRTQAAKGSPEDFLRYLLALQQAEQGWRHAAQPRIYLEALLVKLCHFKKLVPLKTILQDLAAGSPSGSGPKPGGPTPPKASGRTGNPPEGMRPSPPGPPKSQGKAGPFGGPAAGPAPEVAAPASQEVFPRVLETLRRDKAALAAVLAQYSSVRIKGNLIEVFFENGKGFFADTVQKDIRSVEKAASEVLGIPATVRLTEETAAPADPGRGTARELEAALKDPAVQYFVDTFKAQVLSVDPVKRAPHDKDPKARGPQDGKK
jgi:DNA polymerase-3 subunit gamma/tau